MKKRIAAAALAAILLRLALLTGGAREALAALGARGVDVRISIPGEASPAPEAEADMPGELPLSAPETPKAAPEAAPPEAVPEAPDRTPQGQDIRPTTIPGGLTLRNATSFEPDTAALLAEGPGLRLPQEGVQVLIVHTHGSEAYTPDAADAYVSSDPFRTQDTSKSVIHVGDALCAALEKQGLTVAHDREIYDWPSYTGSYSRSGAAVSDFLALHPETAVVIDLHRDALGTDELIYKTVAQLSDEQVSSQLMLVVGTGESGLEHPRWRENLALALYLQEAVCARWPTLARPISLVKERYNQQLSPGMLILEVGSSGNTLREAVAAAEAFAEAVGPKLLELVEE